jgi:hypothetical protein
VPDCGQKFFFLKDGVFLGSEDKLQALLGGSGTTMRLSARLLGWKGRFRVKRGNSEAFQIASFMQRARRTALPPRQNS